MVLAPEHNSRKILAAPVPFCPDGLQTPRFHERLPGAGSHCRKETQGVSSWLLAYKISFRKDFHVELIQNVAIERTGFYRFVGLLTMLTAGGLDQFWKCRSPKKGVAT